MDLLYRWRPAKLEQSDPAGVADGMKMALIFNGEGQKQATKAEQEAMAAFIGNLVGVQ